MLGVSFVLCVESFLVVAAASLHVGARREAEDGVREDGQEPRSGRAGLPVCELGPLFIPDRLLHW